MHVRVMVHSELYAPFGASNLRMLGNQELFQNLSWESLRMLLFLVLPPWQLRSGRKEIRTKGYAAGPRRAPDGVIVDEWSPLESYFFCGLSVHRREGDAQDDFR